MQLSTIGKLNTAVGQKALYQTSASNNTSIGQDSLYNHVFGNNNVALGFKAGKTFSYASPTPLTSASNSTFIGSNTQANANDETNQIVIGYDAFGVGSNSVVLGNHDITKTILRGNVGIGTDTPTSRLTVKKGTVTQNGIGDCQFRIEFSDDFQMGISHRGKFLLRDTSLNNDFRFFTSASEVDNGNERFTILNGGGIGLGGATEPQITLGIGDNDTGISYTASDNFKLQVGGSSAIKLGEGDDANGNEQRVQVHGGLAIFGVNTSAGNTVLRYNTSTKTVTEQASTRKIKKDIITLSPEIYNSVLELNPVLYKRRDDDSSEMGFIAEEIAALHPTFAGHGPDYKYNESGSRTEIPIYEDDGTTISHTDYELDSDSIVPMSIETNAILAAAVAKIQELEARLKVLEG